MSIADKTSQAIFGITSGELPRRTASALKSKYEAADTDSSNERHWANADGLSGRAANSPDVRRNLRERGRHEFDNGSNCKGPIETIGHDMIGTGPRLQLKPPDGVSEEAAREITRKFQDWCEDPAVDFADKLRIMVESEFRDGESFGLLVRNPGVRSPVQLDIRVIDTEQCATPQLLVPDEFHIDGIDFDRHGNPTAYHILNTHPGDGFGFFASTDATAWPADSVMHWYRGSRASHARGVPRITPGLGLYAHVRNFTRSVLGAARIAAMFAGILKTNLPPDGGPVAVEAYDVIPFDHDGLLTAPAGWELNQMKAEQPVSTYKDFRDTVCTEIGRGIHAPKSIMLGDSSTYNYSSFRGDLAVYRGALTIARNRLEIRVLDRVFKAWYAEAVMITDYIPGADALPDISEWTWTWRYDAYTSLDPVKDATASEMLLNMGLLTMQDALNDLGKDFNEHFRQLDRERQLLNSIGLEHPYWLAQKAAMAKAMPAQPGQQNTPAPAADGTDETVLDLEEPIHA